MLAIRTELEAIAQELGMIYLRALNPNDLNQRLQSLTIDKPLLILANVPEFADEPITSNLNWGRARTTILFLDKNQSPDPKPEEIDLLLDSLLEKVKFAQDLLDRSEVKVTFADIEYISLNSADQIELTDEVISGWELVADIPMVRELYYCPTPPPPDYSPEALAVFALMPNEPSGALKDIIARFVDNEVLANNWAKYDDFAVYSLGMESEANALQSWIRPVQHTNNGAVIGAQGATLAGAEWIDTNYNPANGVNYQLNDAQAEVFINNWTPLSALQAPLGSGFTLQLFDELNNNRFRFSVNSNSRIVNADNIESDTLYSQFRDNSSSMNIAKNGVPVSYPDASTSITSLPVFIGARNNAGVADLFMTGTISTFMAGGVLPDQAAHYNNIRQLLIDLGAIPALLSL